MIQRAAGFIVRSGPVSPQDRWEEDAGYSPFTLGAEIAALLVAADCADAHGEDRMARYLRETADCWNASLDSWMYVTDTSLARKCGVDGYYVRVAEPDEADAASPRDGFVPIKNRPPSESSARAALTVSPDALALVRFGLRAADDPRILNTVKVIDALLRVDTPRGPVVASLQRRRLRRAGRRQRLRRNRHRPRVAAAHRRAGALRIGGGQP